MKNFIKKFSVYLTVVMCLVSMVVMAVPGFAADDVVFNWSSIYVLPDRYGLVFIDGTVEQVEFGNYSGDLYDASNNWDRLLPAGSYYVTGNAYTDYEGALAVLVMDTDEEINEVYSVVNVGFGEVFTVEHWGLIRCQSYNIPPLLYRVAEDTQPEGLYYSAYELLQEAFYGADVELTDAQDMTLTMMATLAALFVIVVPFIVVWFVITMLGRWR